MNTIILTGEEKRESTKSVITLALGTPTGFNKGWRYVSAEGVFVFVCCLFMKCAYERKETDF